MHAKLGPWVLGYGAFLVAMGVAGYLSNPEKAATALASGGTFGGLSILWGFLLRRGSGWARWAAAGTTALLTAVFAWRGAVSWLAVLGGQEGKVVAALIITAMGIASVVTLVVLLSAGRARAPAPSPAP